MDQQENKTRFTILYAQIAVFEAGLQNPFNDWTEKHVRQGFSWRPGSVSFRTIEETGKLDVLLTRKPFALTGRNAIRAIRVPFTVANSGKIDIASITEAKEFEMPEGQYELIFETGKRPDGFCWAAFHFLDSQEIVSPAVLVAGSDIDPQEPFLMEAKPA
ncbi:MAG: competence protein [Planctomycetes bacterium]|nr:competence protein [Planctomycetota bacterium]